MNINEDKTVTWSTGRQRLLSQRLVPAGHQQRPGSCGWREQSARLVAATMGQAASSSPSTQSQCLQWIMLRLRMIYCERMLVPVTHSVLGDALAQAAPEAITLVRQFCASILTLEDKTIASVEQNMNVSCRLYLENGCVGLNVFEWTEQRGHFRVENIIVNSHAIEISVSVLTSHDTFKIDVIETGDD